MKLWVRWDTAKAKRIAEEWQRQANEQPERTKNRLFEAGEMVIRNAQFVQMGGERTRALFQIVGGRLKRRKEPRPVTAKPHQVGILFGMLRTSISQDVTHVGNRWQSEIGPKKVPYARIHELGGPVKITRRTKATPAMDGDSDGAKPKRSSKKKVGRDSFIMPRRPYLLPAMKETEKSVLEIVGRAFVFESTGDLPGRDRP